MLDKTFQPAEVEPRIYDMWEARGCFRAGAGAEPGAAPFCVVIPPPNVTGSLHMGHALNNTLQDVLVRFARMRGRAVLEVFVSLYKEGLIYKDKRLVNWDPKLLTAISDLEVQQVETKGHLWHFRYPVEDDSRF